MTPKISLISVVAVVALAVVPSAFGAVHAGSEGSTTVVSSYRDANERGSTPQLAVQPAASGYRDANERGALKVVPLSGSREAFDRSVVAGQLDLSTFNAFERGMPVQGLDSNISTYRDAFERGTPVAGSPDVPTITSGREIEWPQIGIGFGVGLLLALGLGLALRMTPIRPAH